ncbi:hypothetical protein JYT59_00665 [Sphingobacteriaceae bacterium AH-315-L07]|nr:hypothetical protein [Bacteroidia bacterium]MBN4052242.1 hypothetical protein [Sphingobacteriaceae bacterium AH-315-L07]
MFIRISFCLLLVTVLSSIFYSCKKDDDTDEIPDVLVDRQLIIVNYPSLTAVNGWEYISGGSKGIIVYRVSTDEFKAYDRNCSYEPLSSCAKCNVDSSGLTAIDTCCGSEFQLLDGSVLTSPATKPLREYQTSYDGSILTITN